MSVIKIDSSAATTTATNNVTVFASGSAFDRPYFIVESSGLTGAAGSNSAFGIQMRYLAPGGNAIVIASTGLVTINTNGIFNVTLSAPFGAGANNIFSASCAQVPMPSQIQYVFSTAGTAIGAAVYVVVPNR